MRENQVHKCLWIIHRKPSGDLEYGRHAFYGIHGRFASIEDKLSAARMYADASRVLTWHINGGEAQLVRREDGRTDRLWRSNGVEVQLIKREDGKLERLVIDNNSRQIGIDLVGTGGRPIENAIEILSQCTATVDSGLVVFSRCTPCEYWPEPISLTGNKELRLVRKGDDLIWRLFDKTTKKVSWVYACSMPIRAIKIWCEGLYPSETPFFRDFRVETFFDNLGGLCSVYISKIQAQSRLDPKKIIDRDNWAITLISAGTCGIDPVSWGGHAMIAYEGIEGGKPFLRYAHLGVPRRAQRQSDGTVEIVDDTTLHGQGRKLVIHSQSETWMRSRGAIRVMEERIKEEVGKVLPFNPFMGAYSGKTFIQQVIEFFTGSQPVDYADSCLSWAVRNIYSTGIILPFWRDMSILPKAYISHIALFPSLVKPDNILAAFEHTPSVLVIKDHLFPTSINHRVSSFNSDGT